MGLCISRGTYTTALAYYLFFAYTISNNHLFLAHTTTICTAIATVQTIFLALLKEKERSLMFLRYLQIWRIQKGDSRNTISKTLKWLLYNDCYIICNVLLPGELKVKDESLWSCGFSIMFNYMLLCGSKGFQNQLIKELM